MRSLNVAAFFAYAVTVVIALQTSEASASEGQASETVSTRNKGHHHHKGHHHKHHHGHHHKHHKKGAAHVASKHEDTHVAKVAAAATKSAAAVVVMKAAKANVSNKVNVASKAHANATKVDREGAILEKMKALEAKLSKKKAVDKVGQILVNGPLPVDFAERFIQGVSEAIGVETSRVKVKSTSPSGTPGVMMVTFSSNAHVVDSVQDEASDPDSKLANGNLHSFLVAPGPGDDSKAVDPIDDGESSPPQGVAPQYPVGSQEATPIEAKGIDIDTAMPYGDLEPFGREDTAQELTEDSIKESDQMVDQLERAEVAEEKRAVFRALTRLRGAAITSFDGVARSQTGNIDEYNKVHQWRRTHPLHHLADEESDVSKWAFPDNADF